MKKVFILQGWGTTQTIYNTVKEYFENNKNKKYKAYTFDFPGFPNGTELNKPWSLNDYVNWTKNYINKRTKNAEKIILFGHSFGVRVITKMLNNFEDVNFSVEKIYFVGSAGVKNKRTFKQNIRLFSYKILKKLKKPLLFKTDYLFPFLNEKLKNYYKNAGSSDYKVLNGTMKKTFSNIVNEDLTNTFKNINVPTIIIHGENDKSIPVAHAKTIHKEIKNSKLFIIKKADHYPFLSNPNEFYKVIKSN